MLSREFSNAVKTCWNIIINSSLEIRLSFFAACLLDIITVSMSVAAPAVLKMLVDSLSTEKTTGDVAWLGAAYGLTWLGAEVLLRVRGILAAVVVEKIKCEATRRFCLNSIFSLDLKADEIPGDVFATKLNQTNMSLPMFIDGLMWQIAPLLVRLVLSVSLLVQFVPPVYSLLLVFTVLTFVVISFFSYKGVGERQKASNMSAQATHWKIMDALKNKTIIIAHADESEEFKHIERALVASTKSAIGAVNFSQAISALQVMVLGVGLTMTTVLSARDLSEGIITIGDFVQINAYVLQFVLPVSYVGMILSAVKRTSVTIAENAGRLTLPSVLFDASKRSKLLVPPTITLDKVCVRSPDGGFRLKNVSISINSGASLAVVGNSGAGKSTLAKTILGLVALDSGVIRVDSQELSSNTIQTFRKSVGYVPQEPFLFDRSVKDNVFGGAVYDNVDTRRMLEVSGIYGDQGFLECGTSNSLSGGEKQRVSFARAMARYPSVIILDEPTSSLDKVTKRILSSAIYTALESATRVIITHDLEEASKAEKIVVMDNGQIVEFGSHLELLKSGGWYSRHWQLSILAANVT